MKRFLKFLARLYPSAWRNRYGAEYEALLEQTTPRTRDAVDVFWGAIKMQMTSWNFVRIVLPCALVGGLVATVVSFKTPVRYTSGTMVLQSSPEPESHDRLAPTAAVQSQGLQIPELARDAFADREAMARIIRQFNLYPIERTKMPLDDVVEKMRSAIHIRPASQSSLDEELRRVEERTPWLGAQVHQNFKKHIISAFTVEFEYPDPHVAQMVDASLVSLLTARNLRLAAGRLPASCSWGCILVTNAPTLPVRPTGLNRTEQGAIGLSGGLIGGLILAAVFGLRRGSTVVRG